MVYLVPCISFDDNRQSRPPKLNDTMVMRQWHALYLSLASNSLSGCATRGAPSLALLFGAFLPVRMVCAMSGIVAATVSRAIFAFSGVANVLPFQFFVCTAISTCIASLAGLGMDHEGGGRPWSPALGQADLAGYVQHRSVSGRHVSASDWDTLRRA
jgi:hypothetical protein